MSLSYKNKSNLTKAVLYVHMCSGKDFVQGCLITNIPPCSHFNSSLLIMMPNIMMCQKMKKTPLFGHAALCLRGHQKTKKSHY